MTEIYDNLIVCSQDEYNYIDLSSADYSVAFCAKHPFHKFIVGYKGNLDKNHPEYLIAKRPEKHMIAANLIDVDVDGYVSDYIIESLIKFIDEELSKNRIVLLVCNQGRSRSSSVGLMYLLHVGKFMGYTSFFMVEQAYKEICPSHNPSLGMQLYTARYWERLRKMEEENNHD